MMVEVVLVGIVLVVKGLEGSSKWRRYACVCARVRFGVSASV